jgi:hypothetical protein
LELLVQSAKMFLNLVVKSRMKSSLNLYENLNNTYTDK